MADPQPAHPLASREYLVTHLAGIRNILAHCVPSPELDDLVQIVAEALLRKHPPFEKAPQFWRWIQVVGRRAARKRLDSSSSAGTELLDSSLAAPEERSDVVRAAEREETSQLIDDASGDIPPRERRLLAAFHVDGRTIRAIATTEGTSIEATKSALRLARAHFRFALLSRAPTLADLSRRNPPGA